MSRKQDYLLKELSRWRDEGLIDDAFHDRIAELYRPSGRWDLQALVRWFLIVGAACLGVGVIGVATAVLVSVGLLSWILVLSGGGLLALGFWLAAAKARWNLPKTGNAVIVVGCLLLGASVFTFAKALAPEGNHWSVLLLVVSILYLVVAYVAKNAPVLTLALLALATWFGSESGYVSGWGAYYFGMNYPVRFAVASPLVIALGYVHQRCLPQSYQAFTRVYYAIGMLYLSLALWILSIWGPGQDLLMGTRGAHLVLAAFSVLWLLVSLGMLLVGSRFSDGMFRGFGVTFIVINLYTRYFEYFWDGVDKWTFFLVIGALTLAAGIGVERYQKRRRQ